MTLADVEQVVVPALVAGQASVATAQSKTNGLVAPAGVILWARVSDELDKRLCGSPGQPLKLSPKEWKSGYHIWVVLALGDKRVLNGLIQRLQEKEWGRKPAKMFTRSPDGTPIVATLEAKAA